MFGKVYAEGFSMKGQRRSNQDRFAMMNGGCSTNRYVEQNIIVDDGLIYYIVADGVGSLSRGAEAAELAVNSLIEWLKSYPEWCQKKPSESFEVFIQEGFNSVNSIVRMKSQEMMERLGTTLTVLVINRDRYYCANVGDSPVFRLIGDKFWELTEKQTTNDHEGVLRYYIGHSVCSGADMVHISQGVCMGGALFLLCTDGFKGIDHSLIKSKDVQTLYQYQNALNDRRLDDNCTAIKVTLGRLNTTLLEDALERCESNSDYRKGFLDNAERYFENWKNTILERTKGYAVAEFVSIVSKDWGVSPRTVRLWLDNKPSRDAVLRMCASLNYSVHGANKLLEKDAHYSRLDPSNFMDYAWCKLLDSKYPDGISLAETYAEYLEEAKLLLGVEYRGNNYDRCVELINQIMKSENVNVHNIWADWSKAKKVYDYLSGKRKKGQYLPRYLLVAFGLHMNLTLTEINNLLREVGMSGLRSKNVFEATLIYVLSKLELEAPELFSDAAVGKESDDQNDQELLELVLNDLEMIYDEISTELQPLYHECYKELVSNV